MNKPIYCTNDECSNYSFKINSLCYTCKYKCFENFMKGYLIRQKYKLIKKASMKINSIIKMKHIKNQINNELIMKKKSVEKIQAFIKMCQEKNKIYILDDSSVTKSIIKKGNGVYPTINQMIKVNYTGYLLNNTIFDSSEEPFEFQLGNKDIIELWNIALPTMSKGEIAMITGISDYCYKELNMPKIPPNSTLKFKIEVIDFYDAPKTMDELSEEEKISFLNDYKVLGKDAFLNNDLKNSMNHYKKACEYAENLKSDETIHIYNNLSLVSYKLDDFNLSGHYAQLAYKIDNNNVKSLFRLAHVHFKLENYDISTKICNQLLEIDSNNISIKKLLYENKKNKKIEKNKIKNMCQKMFS